MGDIIRFNPRRKRKWTRPDDYLAGRRQPRPPKPPRFDPGGRKRRAGWMVALAWTGLLAAVAAWVAWDNRALFAAEPDPATLAPQTIEARWTRCGEGPSRYCVIDGDSFVAAGTRYRLAGLDAPELAGKCPQEKALAERSAVALTAWLNDGPAVMEGDPASPADKYGRPLRRMTRGAGTASASQALIAAGLARSYSGEARQAWCPGT